ncbi:MAG: DUF5658 family protein [Dehalococcoidales bacterium]|nr:DUF5658 family protein [Dehalococcoidales bacterium]
MSINRKLMLVLLGVLVVFVVADGLVTEFLVSGGIAREGNPFLESIVGQQGFILLKVVGAVACAFVLWDIYRRFPKLALVSTSCFVVIYSIIVLWNLSLAL